jgi:Putative peptidoglycan binding domain
MSFRVQSGPNADSPFLFADARTAMRETNTLELEGPFELGEAPPSSGRSAPEYLRWVQSALNRALGTKLIVDGRGGPATRAAVAQFQRRHNLNPDGIVGPTTETALASASAVPAPALIRVGQSDIVRGGTVVTGGTCPTEFAEVVRGWGQYEDKVERLAQAEQDKINKLADLIVATFTTPGCVPLGQITVVGHADQDFHGAAFEKKVSDERAQSVAAALSTAIIKAFKARKINRLAKGAIAFLPSPIGVGATQPDAANVPRVTDRTLNRRVTIQLHQRGAPVPPPDTFDARVERFVKLLATNKVVPDPTGKRTERAKCILGKIRRPGILDVFVDGTAANQTVGPHKVAGNLCSFQGKYDPPPISNADFAKFLGTVSNVLKGPGFAPTVPDDKILSGLSGLILMINEGIIRVERYITLNSSDFGYVGDKTRGTRLSSIFADHLNDENSIYSCYKDFHGNE